MIGLVTYEKYPDLTDDDRPLIDELAELRLRAIPVRWDDPSARWEDFQALVLRSSWDYHLRADEFVAWLTAIERARVPLWNPAPLVRWNMHKRYLRDLEAAGIPVPQTEWLARAEARPLPALMAQRGWKEAIIKPAISASATDTWRTTGDVRADDRRFRELLDRCDLLVQEVVPEVMSAGEWSLIFIDGAYSHAAIKRPRSGDFRVQTELGGTAKPARPTAAIVAAGMAITRHIPGDWLFARIDGVVTARGFLLMEVECIEPLLFFAQEPAARTRFARALKARMEEPLASSL